MWTTFGHPRAVDFLERSIAAGRLSHAYLVVGPRHVGKMTLAMDLARLVNCLADDRPCGSCEQCSRIARGVHADVKIVGVETQPEDGARGRVETQPEDGARAHVAILIGQVRQAQREASLKPFEGRCRVFIFDGAELLTEEAANCLLKTLEEPPDQVLLVLLTSDATALLPTVVSRCQRLELRLVPRTVLAAELERRCGLGLARADELARISGGRPGWAISALAEDGPMQRRDSRLEAIEGAILGSFATRFEYASALATVATRDRDEARQELALWLDWWRDALVTREGAAELTADLSRRDTFQRVARALTPAQIAQAIRDVMAAWDHVAANVNPRLALEDLMLRLPRLDR